MATKLIAEKTSAHLSQFNNQLVELIQKLREATPSDHAYQHKLNIYYKNYRKYVDQDRRVDFIEEFATYVSKYSKEVAICDEGLFSEEQVYYPGKTIQLLKGLDFKVLWKLETYTTETKETLWKSFQTLYIIATYVLKENNRVKDLLRKQKQIVADMAQSLQLEQKIKDEAERLNEAERRKAEASGLNLDGLKELFGENNLITEMAVEIAKELDLPSDQLSNPLEAIKVLFGHNGSKLQEIIEKVGHKLTEKINNGQISEQQLVSDAKKMNQTLLSKFKGIPGLPDIEQFSKKVADQVAKDMEAKRANAPEGSEPAKPTFEELTSHLKSNLQEMGFDNIEQFQSHFSEIMADVKQAVPKQQSASVSNSAQSSKPVVAQPSGPVAVQEADTDQQLEQQLASFKQTIDSDDQLNQLKYSK
jgi:hypothetical protein